MFISLKISVGMFLERSWEVLRSFSWVPRELFGKFLRGLWGPFGALFEFLYILSWTPYDCSILSLVEAVIENAGSKLTHLSDLWLTLNLFPSNNLIC